MPNWKTFKSPSLNEGLFKKNIILSPACGAISLNWLWNYLIPEKMNMSFAINAESGNML